MKKILIILILSIFLIGCSPQIDTIPNTPETITSIVTVTSIVEDTEKIEELERKLKQAEEKNQKYYFLIDNLNDLLSNIYYGYAENDKGFSDGFTAFSLAYNNKYYIITAGHCIENECGKFGNFKFKANFSDEWIYPKLLTYKNDFQSNNDYAIFAGDKINKGFSKYGDSFKGEEYILGSIDNNSNIFRKYLEPGISGESGSPIINVEQEILGIYINGYTDIQIVLKAIDNLK